MNTTQEHEKYSTTMLLAVAGDLTRRGEQTLLSVTYLLAVASKHCSLSHIARRGEQSTHGGKRNRVSVGKCDF